MATGGESHPGAHSAPDRLTDASLLSEIEIW
jgi:hypothetical protein